MDNPSNILGNMGMNNNNNSPINLSDNIFGNIMNTNQSPSQSQNTFNSMSMQLDNDFGLNNMNSGLTQTMNMKQIFRNEEITIYCTSSKSSDKANVNATLYLSNNVNKSLSNVKLNLIVIKYVSLKVLSTSGNSLEPNQGLGIKKVIIF